MRNLKILVMLIFTFALSVWGQKAQVRFMIGDAFLRGENQKNEWAKLQFSDQLSSKDFIKTGEQSRVEIQLPDKSQVKVMENSLMQINFKGDAQKPETQLYTLGSFFFKVRKMLGSSFEVKGPASVAAIRGTEFFITNSETQSEI